jgi:hypothetical protein
MLAKPAAYMEYTADKIAWFLWVTEEVLCLRMHVFFVTDEFGYIGITDITDIWCRLESKIPTNTD